MRGFPFLLRLMDLLRQQKFSMLDGKSVEWYNDFKKYAITSNYGELCMEWKEKLARYAPRLGLLLIALFVAGLTAFAIPFLILALLAAFLCPVLKGR